VSLSGATWDDLAEYARCVARSYRRDFWNQQPVRIQVCSEKGTVRGVLAPVLDKYAVGFRVMHDFSSAAIVHIISEDDDGRPLVALYVGDFDPSGLYMSKQDLPKRLAKYKGHHVELRRIALTRFLERRADCSRRPTKLADSMRQRPAHFARWV
jgi:hypothetical protein